MSGLSATEGSLVAFQIFAILGLILYALFPKKAKWTVLLVLSYAVIFLLSYYWVIFLIIATVIVFLCGLWISHYNKVFDEKKEGLSKEEKKALKAKLKKKQKLVVILGLVASYGVLALLKYFNLPIGEVNEFFTKFAFGKILFPILGISYYTLSATGYLIDVYRKKYDCERNIFKLALFIGFFPLQIEGPICRYDKMKPYLYKETNPTYDNLAQGGTLILWGVFKKIVIADRLVLAVKEVFNNYNDYHGIIIVVGVIFYAFQLYCDFSGYVDIARGVSKLFGIETEENFDRPFMSKSVSEFWRRWHMSLGSWLRDYVFYSVALSKPYMAINKKISGKCKAVIEKLITTAIPMFFVWLICGIWHGAGIKFIVYGMYFYFVMMIGILLEPVHIGLCKLMHLNRDGWFVKTLAIIRTFILVCIGLMMFRATSLTHFFEMIKAVFSGGHTDLIGYGLLIKGDVVLMFVLVAFIMILEIISEFKSLKGIYNKCPIYVRFSLLLILLFVIIIFGAYGGGYSAIDPMYAAY